MLNSSKAKAKDVAMPFELNINTDGVMLILRGRLGVQQARPLWDSLQPSLLAGSAIELQAEQLEDMDTSIIQILYRANSESSPLRFGKISAGFTSSLKRRGMDGWFIQNPPASSVSNSESPQLKPRKVRNSRKARSKHV
jgi:hypothetical protein